jgi:hypothetical protein
MIPAVVISHPFSSPLVHVLCVILRVTGSREHAPVTYLTVQSSLASFPGGMLVADRCFLFETWNPGLFLIFQDGA